MAFEDFFRVSVHAVFTNESGKVLLLKATYGDFHWGLPGGSLDPGETIHEALLRECFEEVGVRAKILYLSGIYFHQKYNAQCGVFRCEMEPGSEIRLSDEHSEYGYFTLAEMGEVQRCRVQDCLAFNGEVKSAKFL